MNPDLKELIADIRENVLYLKELGVDSLEVDLSALSVAAAAQPQAAQSGIEPGPPRAAAPAAEPPKPPVPDARPAEKARPRPGERLSSLPSLTARKSSSFFDKYNPGQPDAVPRAEPEAAAAPVPAAPLPEPTETIEQIRAEIGPNCMRCKLSELGRKQVVNSTGNFQADLMFVGEAPGADEDEQGAPFVGRAGQLLTDIIEKGLQMPRSEVFIGNINRCRPPGNRAPEPDETATCRPFLQREIAVVRPRVIVVLGATAAHNLLETKVPIGKLRGRFHDYLGTKVMPTFHPAYLLRDPHKKREVWEDIKLVKAYLEAPK